MKKKLMTCVEESTDHKRVDENSTNFACADEVQYESKGNDDTKYELDSNITIQNLKRKRFQKPSRRQAEEILRSIISEVISALYIEHDCGFSAACPAWWCELVAKNAEIKSEIEKLTEEMKKLDIDIEQTKKEALSTFSTKLKCQNETIPTGWRELVRRKADHPTPAPDMTNQGSQ